MKIQAELLKRDYQIKIDDVMFYVTIHALDGIRINTSAKAFVVGNDQLQIKPKNMHLLIRLLDYLNDVIINEQDKTDAKIEVDPPAQSAAPISGRQWPVAPSVKHKKYREESVSHQEFDGEYINGIKLA